MNKFELWLNYFYYKYVKPAWSFVVGWTEALCFFGINAFQTRIFYKAWLNEASELRKGFRKESGDNKAFDVSNTYEKWNKYGTIYERDPVFGKLDYKSLDWVILFCAANSGKVGDCDDFAELNCKLLRKAFDCHKAYIIKEKSRHVICIYKGSQFLHVMNNDRYLCLELVDNSTDETIKHYYETKRNEKVRAVIVI